LGAFNRNDVLACILRIRDPKGHAGCETDQASGGQTKHILPIHWAAASQISLTVRHRTRFLAYKKGPAKKSLGEQNCSLTLKRR